MLLTPPAIYVNVSDCHSAYGRLFFPLYTFLYHEFVVMQGGFGAGPEPYHTPIRSACNLVMGEIREASWPATAYC